MAGRKNAPTALHILKGNPGRRNLKARAAREMEPPEMTDVAPDFFSDSAKKAWGILTPMLKQQGILKETDIAAYQILCESYGRWMLLTEKIKDNFFVKNKSTGLVEVNPLVRLQDEAFKKVARMIPEFGISPAARSKVHVTKKPKKTGWEDI